MKIDDIKNFIKWEDKRLRERFDNPMGMDDEKRILARTVKLSEEVGELANEILKSRKMQRKDKLEENREKIEAELADVIIVTLMLGEALEVDVWESLKKKIEVIRQRNYD